MTAEEAKTILSVCKVREVSSSKPGTFAFTAVAPNGKTYKSDKSTSRRQARIALAMAVKQWGFDE